MSEEEGYFEPFVSVTSSLTAVDDIYNAGKRPLLSFYSLILQISLSS